VYVEHDATVCVLVNVSLGTAGNPTDTVGSPDCRSTQGTDTEPQAPTFPGAIPLFFFTTSPTLILHTTFLLTKLQHSLTGSAERLRVPSLQSPQSNSRPVRHAATQRIPYYESCKTGLWCVKQRLYLSRGLLVSTTPPLCSRIFRVFSNARL
jgi:hypothetical protein